jgi:transcriptional regulator with XRE-family HTH domain
MDPAELLLSARQRHRLSQRALALRAGTTQAWVSAIERGKVHPSVEIVERLLFVMGEELVLGTKPMASDAEHDAVAFAASRALTPAHGSQRRSNG